MRFVFGQRKEEANGTEKTRCDPLSCLDGDRLALGAIVTASASAGEFRTGGKTFTAAGISSETAAGIGPLFLFSVPAIDLHVHCETLHWLNIVVLKGGTIHVEWEALECEILNNPSCTIFPEEEEGGEAGTMRWAASGGLALHAGAHYWTSANSSFTTVYLAGPKCVLPKENLMSGSIAFSLPSALSELVNQPIADINSATEALLGVALHFGGWTAELGGELGSIHLTGKNLGKTWGAE